MLQKLRSSRVPHLLIAALLIAPSIGAQSDEQPATSDVAEELEVRLVQLPITARDRQGNPVTDLTAQELKVKLRGTEKKIAFLEPLAPVADNRPLPKTRLRVDAPGSWQPEAESQEATAGKSRYFVVFADMENDWKLGRPDALAQALKFVEETLQPTDRFAVISYDGELRLEAPFTNHGPTILAAIEKAYSRSTGRYLDLTRRILNLVEQMTLCQTGESSFVAEFDEICIKDTAVAYSDMVRPRADGFVKALDGAVQYLSGVEGRKTILALSHGFAVEPESDIIGAARAVYGNSTDMVQWLMGVLLGDGVRPDLDRLINEAISSGVAIHFIDRNPVPNVAQSARSAAAFQPTGERPVAGAHAAAQADIEEVASSTGGVLVKTLDVYEGLSRAMDLERGAYMLGYYLDQYVSPAKLGKAKVSSTRGKVKIAHRRGAYAEPGSSVGDDRVNSAIIIGDATPLEGEGREGLFVPFHILAEPRDIGYEPIKDQVASTFSMHVRLSTADGRELRDSYHLIQHSYPLELWESTEIEPIIFGGWVELPPGDYRLRAYIRNPKKNREGVAETAIRVPGA
ncbi:MAG: VWA domain-containing protein [Acidobacteriota bacterium]|nr:VWA domain-containing protein [Acidobacteriota bacterium]